MRIPDEEATPGEEQNKYINASWILFKDFKQKFIASQVSTRCGKGLSYFAALEDEFRKIVITRQ